VPLLHVYNKADAAAPAADLPPMRLACRRAPARAWKTAPRLLQQAGWQAAPEGLFIARTRHVQALRARASTCCARRHMPTQRDAALDLLAEELRLAHQALGEITGAFSATTCWARSSAASASG
jgi:tRNA modification GTPase